MFILKIIELSINYPTHFARRGIICLAVLSHVSSQAQITQPRGIPFVSRLVFALSY